MSLIHPKDIAAWTVAGFNFLQIKLGCNFILWVETNIDGRCDHLSFMYVEYFLWNFFIFKIPSKS